MQGVKEATKPASPACMSPSVGIPMAAAACPADASILNCAEAGKRGAIAAQNAARQIIIREDIATVFVRL